MVKFLSFYGTVTAINDIESGCFKMFSVDGGNGNTVGFVIAPLTYFVGGAVVSVGDKITAYYDGNAPVPMIFPPEYLALVVAKDNPYQSVKTDYFDSQLVSSDGQLKLNIANNTPIVLANGQPFNGDIRGRNLIVIYSVSTRSIPAQTTPDKVIVWCY